MMDKQKPKSNTKSKHSSKYVKDVPVSMRRKLLAVVKIALYSFIWLIAWSAIAFGMAVVLIMSVVSSIATDGVITPQQANNSVLVVILIVGALFLGTVWLMRKAKSLSYRVSRYVLLVCTVIGLLAGIPMSLLGVWQPDNNTSNSAVSIDEKKPAPKRYQYMVCTDLSYRHYTDEQMKSPNVGFTDGGKDYCAENNQGEMLKLVENRSEADKIRQDKQNAERAEYIPYTPTKPSSHSKDKETCRTDYTYHGYEIEWSDAMRTGESKTKQKGVDGERVICTDREGNITRDEVTQKPIKEIEVHGTAIPPRNDYPSNSHSCGYYASLGLANSTYAAGCKP